MAVVQVTLDQNEILEACRYWATHRVLNVGKALSAELSVTVCQGKPTGTLNSATVWVETEYMARKSQPDLDRILSPERHPNAPRGTVQPIAAIVDAPQPPKSKR